MLQPFWKSFLKQSHPCPTWIPSCIHQSSQPGPGDQWWWALPGWVLEFIRKQLHWGLVNQGTPLLGVFLTWRCHLGWQSHPQSVPRVGWCVPSRSSSLALGEHALNDKKHMRTWRITEHQVRQMLFHCSSPPAIIYIPFHLLTCNLKPAQCQQPNPMVGQLTWNSPHFPSFSPPSLSLLLRAGIRLATVRHSRSRPRKACVPVQWLNMGPVYFFRVAIFKGLE